MKTLTTPLITALVTASILIATSAFIRAENGARGGAADLMRLTQPQSAPVKSEKIHQHESNCADCRDLTSTRTMRDGKRNEPRTVIVQEHLCGECKNTVQTKGHGKATTVVAMHSCEKVATKASSCCAN